MQNNLFYIMVISLLFISCNNESDVEIKILNKEEISIDESVNMLLINNSNKNHILSLNNIDTITISESYSLYYKIYDKDFKELEKEDIRILDGEFLISEDYEKMKQKKQDSLNYWQEFILPAKDTLRFTFYIKKRFYDTPLSYQTYSIYRKKIYYISFFYKNVHKTAIKSDKEEYIQYLQSNYYRLKINNYH